MTHQNQHYVSEVLLKRFADDGLVHRFNIRHNTWKRVSPKQVFSGLGYTQLMAYGQADNSLEDSFGKIETNFPTSLHALDNAATKNSSELPVTIYDNLIWYCAYLWRMSPFAKAASPVEFVYQLDMDLGHGRTDILKAIGIQASDIRAIQNLHAKGAKFIIHASNYLQLIYRIQFVRKCKEDYMRLRYFTKWILYNAPIELPLSDVAFFQFFDRPSQTQLYILPLAPRLVLIGTVKAGVQIMRSTDTIIKTGTLTHDEAEYILDAICLSAFTALVFKNRATNVLAFRKRAIQKQISFPKIKNLDAVLTAGTKPFDGTLLIRPVSKNEYVAFLKSFIEN